MNPLKLRTGVQERYAGIIEPGQDVEFRVESFGDAVFHGKVAYVSPALDQTMRTFAVEAIVDNADRRLKPGFFAKGIILTQATTKACWRFPTAPSPRLPASRRSTSSRTARSRSRTVTLAFGRETCGKSSTA